MINMWISDFIGTYSDFTVACAVFFLFYALYNIIYEIFLRKLILKVIERIQDRSWINRED